MSTESTEPTDTDETEAETAAVDDETDVAVHFESGAVAAYAAVVQADGADWLYAQRLPDREDGRDEPAVDALDATAVCRITAPRVHLYGGGTVHLRADTAVDPAAVLAESWLDADATLC